MASNNFTSTEVSFRSLKQNKPFYTKHYLTGAERRDLGRQAGDPGVLLYEYLLRMTSIGTENITDAGIAEYFGWDPTKAKRVRLKLTRLGWFASESYRYTGGRKGITYYVGKDAVKDFSDG